MVLTLLDGALLAARRGGLGRIVRAWAAACPLVLLALLLYDLERVEGVRSLRPVFAAALVLAFYARAIGLSRIAREYVLLLRPGLPVDAVPAPPLQLVCTASVVGFGLWLWLWPLVGLVRVAPLAVAAGLPFLALRGAVAPSWLARASCAPESGLAALGQSFDDSAGMRGPFVLVELATLFGALGLFANLYALTGSVLLFGHALLGLDVALLTEFLSLDNGFVLLVLAAATLVLLEPLRAAISAQAFVEARSRRDGADLYALVDRALAESSRPRSGVRDSAPPRALLIWLALALACGATQARAEAPHEIAEPEHGAPSQLEDRAVSERAQRILGRSEFREWSEHEPTTLRDLFKRFFDWLDQVLRDRDQKRERSSEFKLPRISPWMLMALLALALGLLAVYVLRQRPRNAARAQKQPELLLAALEPVALLDDAAKLATAGDWLAALRALYLATLAALDRAHLIDYEASKTNWQYSRSLPAGDLRQSFAAFTRIFDRTWYGREPATLADYQACRALAERLCAHEPQERA